MTTILWLTANARARWCARRPLSGDHGEGVISAAIVVLIMALLGAGMWVAFNQIWTNTEHKTEQNVSQIGS
jgi:hypothetical protein